MTCYDCIQDGHQESSAVGVCARCGLASCPDHAHVLQSHVQRSNGMGSSVSPQRARLFVCNACHTAATAY
ncbi:DUF2180 family protein [Streptomyces sp. NPDC088387]|uniref:DUF2180 family protein n=1 Tax=Streptomyces sp. NPDC088387 TaxID=3365859 RepID=UPI0038136E2E